VHGTSAALRCTATTKTSLASYATMRVGSALRDALEEKRSDEARQDPSGANKRRVEP
jgi:hypothetical protein